MNYHNSIFMKKTFPLILTGLFLFTLLGKLAALPDDSLAKRKLVYQFDIKEEIAPPIWRKTKKALQEAHGMEADLILIHMNTYGGMLDAADSIRTAILKSDIPVFVYIDNNAASAGALISIACDSIYMNPGANIGAATVVDQSGKPLPDKYQSYMRSMMRSTAETSGRDPEIAQAMVDPSIYIEGISDTGKVLTFTAREAVENGYCEGIAESVGEVLRIADMEPYVIVEQKLTAVDRVISLLINPFVSGILIMIIVGGIYFELQTPGIGFPIAASVIAAVLYFAPLYLEGMAENWEVLVFVLGVILIALEVFVIPGFGVAGISGITMVVVGLTLSMVGNVGFDFTGVELNGVIISFFIVLIAMFFALLFSFYFSKKIFTSHIFGHLALEAVQQSDQGFVSSDSLYSTMLGEKGIAHTDLRPAGKVRIAKKVFDATAETGYINKGSKVIVTDYQASQLMVKKV